MFLWRIKSSFRANYLGSATKAVEFNFRQEGIKTNFYWEFREEITSELIKQNNGKVSFFTVGR